MGDMNLPLEPQEPSPLLDEHVHYSGGVVVMPAVVDVPSMGKSPAIVFRFATPAGGFYPPITLVHTDEDMALLEPLMTKSIAMARKAAKK